MGIESLTSSLISEAEKEAKEIVESAEWHVKEMLSDEKAKGSKLLKEAESDAVKRITDLRRERVAWAQLEKKRIMAEAREDAIKTSLDEVYKALSKVKKTAKYRAFMKSAVAAAIKNLEGGRLVVHVLKSDKKFLPKTNSRTKVVTDLDAVGGVIVETADGRMRVNYTLEAVFESESESLRKKISERLFSK